MNFDYFPYHLVSDRYDAPKEFLEKLEEKHPKIWVEFDETIKKLRQRNWKNEWERFKKNEKIKEWTEGLGEFRIPPSSEGNQRVLRLYFYRPEYASELVVFLFGEMKARKSSSSTVAWCRLQIYKQNFEPVR